MGVGKEKQLGAELDPFRGANAPPVLNPVDAYLNLILPEDEAKAKVITAAIPRNQRHKWFRSAKSSQALSQSVFGGLLAFNHFDLLEGLYADCGRSAFLTDLQGSQAIFEHELACLNEIRPTSIDLLVRRGPAQVAVECKFTEAEFGTCSRTRLSEDRRYHCNGSYRAQKGRRSRCALTEQGMLYWNHIPQYFRWPADQDHDACPFGRTYQLVRNALAVALLPDGAPNPAIGHVLVVYDERNPEFQEGGRAGIQWEVASDACESRGLLRKVSWQRIAGAISRAPELRYLVEELEGKYGINSPQSSRC